jgi:hypothetical protein
MALSQHAKAPYEFMLEPRAGQPFHTEDIRRIASALDVVVGSPLNVKAYGATMDGLHDDSAIFARAIAAASDGALIIPEGTLRLASNVTVPQTVTLIVHGRITVDAGCILRIYGPIQAPKRQIFDETMGGAAYIYSGPVYPQWWGAYPGLVDSEGALVDITARFDKMLAALKAVNGGKVIFSKGTYNGNLDAFNFGPARPLIIEGEGHRGSTIIQSDHGIVVDLGATNRVTMTGIEIKCLAGAEVGLFTGRYTAQGAVGSFYRMQDMRIVGRPSVAGWLCIGAEVSTFEQVHVDTDGAAPGLLIAKEPYYSNADLSIADALYEGPHGAISTTTCHTTYFNSCQFWKDASQPGPAVELGYGASEVEFNRCYFVGCAADDSSSTIEFNGHGGQIATSRIVIKSGFFEQNNYMPTIRSLNCTSSSVVSYLVILDTHFGNPARGEPGCPAIDFATVPMIVDRAHIDRSSTYGGQGLWFGKITNSYVNWQGICRGYPRSLDEAITEGDDHFHILANNTLQVGDWVAVGWNRESAEEPWGHSVTEYVRVTNIVSDTDIYVTPVFAYPHASGEAIYFGAIEVDVSLGNTYETFMPPIVGTMSRADEVILRGAGLERSYTMDYSPLRAKNLRLSQGDDDDAILRLASSDTDHGMTDIAPTDEYGQAIKAHATNAGLNLRGFGANIAALNLTGYATNDNTTKTNAGYGAVNIDGFKKSGAGAGALGANANVLSVRNNGNAVLHVSAEGNVNALGSLNAATTLSVGAVITQQKYVQRWVAAKAGIADNTATSLFRVTTTDETGSVDGGGYAVFVRALVGHALVNNTGGAAAGAYTFAFSRALLGAGTGANSVITAVAPAGTATTSAPARDIASVTASLVETSEYQNDFQLTIDLSGSSVSTASVVLEVTLLWYGFTTAPTLTAL